MVVVEVQPQAGLSQGRAYCWNANQSLRFDALMFSIGKLGVCNDGKTRNSEAKCYSLSLRIAMSGKLRGLTRLLQYPLLGPRSYILLDPAPCLYATRRRR
jgi:hypothetical protein